MPDPIATCGRCGKPMVYNVPRLGPDGGYVHEASRQFGCDAPPLSIEFTMETTSTGWSEIAAWKRMRRLAGRAVGAGDALMDALDREINVHEATVDQAGEWYDRMQRLEHQLEQIRTTIRDAMQECTLSGRTAVVYGILRRALAENPESTPV